MFVVQSLPRCGTHLLRTALQSHGEVVCFGEVFNPYSREHGYPVERPTVAEVLDYCAMQPRQTGFLAHTFVGLELDEIGPGLDRAYRTRPEVRAAGGVWRSIPPRTPVITLRRESLLARYLSELIAHRRARWLVRVGEMLPPPLRVTIHRERMLEDLVRTESLMEIARQRFPQSLNIRYEDLVADPDSTFHCIQAHLGVAQRRLIPGTVKIGRPLTESISNYDDVREWLTGTRYATFLEEPL